MSKKRSRAICVIRIAETDDLRNLAKARAVVGNLKGVLMAEDNHILQILTVEYNPDRIELNAIRDTVKKIVSRNPLH